MARALLRSKILVHSIVAHARRALASALQRTPFVGRWLGLPRYRISSIAAWVEAQQRASDWVERQKAVDVQCVVQSQTVVRQPPHTLHPGDERHVFVRERIHRFNAIFLARIPRARVLGPNGVIVTRDGGVLEECSWGRDWLDRDPIYRSFHLGSARKRDGLHYSIAAPSIDGFAHWMMDALPRLFGLEGLGNDDVSLIVSHPLAGWQLETLRLLDVTPRDIVPLSDGHVEVQTLLMPSFVGSPGNLHPWGCRWLRDRLCHTSVAPGSRRIYVTRRAAGRRKVRNEVDLEPILLANGFDIVDTAALSISDRIVLFADAEMIAGPHGAGMTNALFAPKGCSILELHHPSYVTGAFYSLADALEQPYWYLLGTDAAGTSHSHGSAAHDDFDVSTDEFARTLALMQSALKA